MTSPLLAAPLQKRLGAAFFGVLCAAGCASDPGSDGTDESATGSACEDLGEIDLNDLSLEVAPGLTLGDALDRYQTRSGAWSWQPLPAQYFEGALPQGSSALSLALAPKSAELRIGLCNALFVRGDLALETQDGSLDTVVPGVMTIAFEQEWISYDVPKVSPELFGLTPVWPDSEEDPPPDEVVVQAVGKGPLAGEYSATFLVSWGWSTDTGGTGFDVPAAELSLDAVPGPG